MYKRYRGGDKGRTIARLLNRAGLGDTPTPTDVDLPAATTFFKIRVRSSCPLLHVQLVHPHRLGEPKRPRHRERMTPSSLDPFASPPLHL